jgi:hypothetical protein
MVILTVLMALMKTRRSTTVRLHSLAPTIISHARMADVSTKAGLVTMTMTVETAPMKANSATRSTKPARLKSLLVKTSNVFVINTDAVSFQMTDGRV